MASENREIYINEMQEMLVEAYLKNPRQNLAFRGTPGIGKTDGIYQAAERLREKFPNFFCRVLILSQMEPVDFRMPWVDNQNKYRFIPHEDFKFEPDAKGFLFLDEAANAQADVFKAVQQMLSDRRLGDVTIPPGVMIVLATNNKADRAGVNSIPTAFANRIEWHQVGVDFEGWVSWARRKGLDIRIISYIMKFPNCLNLFKADRDVNATPRSWAKVNDVIDSKFMYDRTAGLLGEEQATQFKAWLSMFEQFPEKEDVEQKPEKAKLPQKADAQFALALALAEWVTPKNWKAFYTYVCRLNLEYQTLYLKESTRIHPKDHFKDTPEYSEWICRNEGKIL